MTYDSDSVHCAVKTATRTVILLVITYDLVNYKYTDPTVTEKNKNILQITTIHTLEVTVNVHK